MLWKRGKAGLNCKETGQCRSMSPPPKPQTSPQFSETDGGECSPEVQDPLLPRPRHLPLRRWKHAAIESGGGSERKQLHDSENIAAPSGSKQPPVGRRLRPSRLEASSQHGQRQRQPGAVSSTAGLPGMASPIFAGHKAARREPAPDQSRRPGIAARPAGVYVRPPRMSTCWPREDARPTARQEPSPYLSRNHAVRPRPEGGMVRAGPAIGRGLPTQRCRTGWWPHWTTDAHPHPGPLPEGEGKRSQPQAMRGLRSSPIQPALPLCNDRCEPCPPLPQGEGWGEGGHPKHRCRRDPTALFRLRTGAVHLT